MKKAITILVAITLFTAFGAAAFAYSESNTFYTTNQVHELSYSSGDRYLKTKYDYGTGWPGDNCSVQAWSETVSNKLAYAYVYLKDEDGETYNGTDIETDGDRAWVRRIGDDDYAMSGTMKARNYTDASYNTIENSLYMYVYDNNN